MKDSWVNAGSCLGSDPDSWFPSNSEGDASRAKWAAAMCGGCPVKHLCLLKSLAIRAQYGVWGGVGEVQRRVMLQRMERVDGVAKTQHTNMAAFRAAVREYDQQQREVAA